MHRGVEMPDEQALSKTAIIIDWKPPEISYSWVSFLVGSHLKYDTSVFFWRTTRHSAAEGHRVYLDVARQYFEDFPFLVT